MLPRQFRLEKFEEIEKVKKEGKLVQSPLFGVLVLERRDDSPSRFAAVISLKISKKAVVRNRSRRLLTEVVRSFLSQTKNGFDLVFLVKSSLIEKKYFTVQKEVELIFKKVGLLGLN